MSSRIVTAPYRAFKAWFRAYLLRLLSPEIHGLIKSYADLEYRFHRMEVANRALRDQQDAVLKAMHGIKLGADISPRDGSWVVMAYRLGDRDYVKFWDFKNCNLGALRQFIEQYEKAQLGILADSPFGFRW